MNDHTKCETIYLSAFFETNSVESAMNLILSDNHVMNTQQRWEAETPFVGDLIIKELGVIETSVVLDYGSGLGRLAKHLIDKTGCRVIGVDISASMRRMSVDYVGSPNFSVTSFDEFDTLLQGGLTVDHAYAVWVLQHSADPSADILRIKRALRIDGNCYLLNARGRCVPCNVGWVNDGVNIFQQMSDHYFQELRRESFDFYGKDKESTEVPISVTYKKLDDSKRWA